MADDREFYAQPGNIHTKSCLRGKEEKLELEKLCVICFFHKLRIVYFYWFYMEISSQFHEPMFTGQSLKITEYVKFLTGQTLDIIV